MTDLAMGRDGAFDIGKVIERTFGVIGANFPTLFGLALVLAALPQAVAALALSPSAAGVPNLSPLWALGSLVAVVASFVLQAAVVHASVVDLNGGKASFGDGLRVGMSNFLPVLGISILMTIGIALGMVLLIVPGVMLAIAWSVAVPAQVVEKTGVIQSFGRSAALTRGSRWAIFGLFFVYLLLAFGFMIVAGLIFAALSFVTGGPESLVMRGVITPLLQAVTSMVGASGAAAVYYELRSKKEGVGPQELAAVFD